MTKNILSLAALLIASATFVACSNDDNIIDEQPVQPTEQVYTMTVNAQKGGDAAANRILEQAAVPIEQQMKENASRDPQIRSGKLHGAIHTGPVNKRRNGGKHITIGVHRKDWNEEDYYPAYVEYGHGGPGPAPAHPYIRPAYDTTEDEAYEIIRDGLRDALNRNG